MFISIYHHIPQFSVCCMEDHKIHEDSYQKQLSKTSDGHNKENEGLKKRSIINERFIIQSMIPVGYFYKTYRGIDTATRKYVTIYLKPTSKERIFSKNIKEELRQKITPSFLWSGSQRIDKNIFDIQVDLKYGPSLYQVMVGYRRRIAEKTLYLLCYHLLKLIDRIDSAGYVHRSINLRNIILGENSQKNQLYFLNTFDLERKGEDSSLGYDVKYCSIGTHLKLKTSSKDTLESMCYTLMDFYLKGSLFGSIKKDKEKEYLQAKTLLKLEGLPISFIQFFQYVKNLNYGEEVKFTQWKIKFKKLIPEEDYSKPYEWIQGSKIKNEEKSFSQASNLLLGLYMSELSPKQNLRRDDKMVELYNELEQSYDEVQMDEHSETEEMGSIGSKVIEIKAFNVLRN